MAVLIPLAIILVLIPIVYRLFYPLLDHDELSSDTYSAKILKTEFSQQKPSKIVEIALNSCYGESNNTPSLDNQSKFECLIQGFIEGYYPSISDRVENIRVAVDDDE